MSNQPAPPRGRPYDAEDDGYIILIEPEDADWVTGELREMIDDILRLLKERPEDSPIMSRFISPLLKGKSGNTSAFILAALTHLKLIRPLPKKQRLHELLDSQPFLDTVEKLMTDAADRPKGTAKKTARKATTKKTSSTV